MSQKLSSHFAVNSWAWLLPIYLIEPFLPVKIYLPVKIFSCLCFYFWGSSFKIHFLREQLYPCFELFFSSFYSYIMVASGCSCVFEKLPARVRKNKNTQSIFNIFNSVYIVDITKSFTLNTTITYTKMTNNHKKRDYEIGVFL